jgi:branched-chain amino acid transport system permease protein
VQLFVSQVLNGIGNGVVYGSIALALVLIFRVTGILNFAQGEMALFSTYVSWKLTTWDVPVIAAIVVSMALAFVAGAVIERVLIRPVEDDHSPLNVVIVTLGMWGL